MGKRQPLRKNTLLIGLDTDIRVLRQRIADRTCRMVEDGLEREVRDLVKIYGWNEVLSQTIGYEEFRSCFEGQCMLNDVIQAITIHTGKLAKRQKTWFRRNPDIHWISNPEEAVDVVTTFLNKGYMT